MFGSGPEAVAEEANDQPDNLIEHLLSIYFAVVAPVIPFNIGPSSNGSALQLVMVSIAAKFSDQLIQSKRGSSIIQLLHEKAMKAVDQEECFRIASVDNIQLFLLLSYSSTWIDPSRSRARIYLSLAIEHSREIAGSEISNFLNSSQILIQDSLASAYSNRPPLLSDFETETFMRDSYLSSTTKDVMRGLRSIHTLSNLIYDPVKATELMHNIWSAQLNPIDEGTTGDGIILTAQLNLLIQRQIKLSMFLFPLIDQANIRLLLSIQEILILIETKVVDLKTLAFELDLTEYIQILVEIPLGTTADFTLEKRNSILASLKIAEERFQCAGPVQVKYYLPATEITCPLLLPNPFESTMGAFDFNSGSNLDSKLGILADTEDLMDVKVWDNMVSPPGTISSPESFMEDNENFGLLEFIHEI